MSVIGDKELTLLTKQRAKLWKNITSKDIETSTIISFSDTIWFVFVFVEFSFLPKSFLPHPTIFHRIGLMLSVQRQMPLNAPLTMQKDQCLEYGNG